MLKCIFQRYIESNVLLCQHESKLGEFCQYPKVDCILKESIRKCDIAKTLFWFNINTVKEGKVKACRFAEICELDHDWIECDEDKVKAWGEEYNEKVKE